MAECNFCGSKIGVKDANVQMDKKKVKVAICRYCADSLGKKKVSAWMAALAKAKKPRWKAILKYNKNKKTPMAKNVIELSKPAKKAAPKKKPPAKKKAAPKKKKPPAKKKAAPKKKGGKKKAAPKKKPPAKKKAPPKKKGGKKKKK